MAPELDRGGRGVAEMLRFLLGYLAGAGIDARWTVLEGNEDFFQVTKRLHLPDQLGAHLVLAGPAADSGLPAHG
jgi:hypothetical protein